MCGTGALVVAEEEQPVLDDGTADHASELILAENIDGEARIEIVIRVQGSIAQELESRAMQGITPRLGDHVDQCAGKVAILRVERISQQPKLLNGVQHRNDVGAITRCVLDASAVDHESVGIFALAVYGDIAGIV